MEPAVDPAPPVTTARWREALGLLAVALLPWLVQPGLIQPDTKVDLTISPVRYLGRALDAWNSHAGLGELQNQAYGYLFPMGPVHVLSLGAGLPAWAVQRVWWSLLLLTGYAGARLLIDRFRLASGVLAIIAALGYACGPRVLTLLADNSVEAWPYAVAPWALLAALPLCGRRLSRRAALHSAAGCGLVAAALGGVNATASGVVLLLPFVYLMSHPMGRRRLTWWIPAVLLGALWWLLPLFVLGRFAYPFLDYIETSRITTAVTAPQHVLRGASDWVAYIVDAQGHPVWQGGWVVAQSATSIIAGCLVAGLGVAGILRTRGHLRRFLIVSVLLGVLAMSIGHATTVWWTDPPASHAVRLLLDGPLAPLRNVHKFDPLVRLPLVLGLARILSAAGSAARVRVRLSTIAICVLVVAAMTPLWQGRLGDAGAFRAIPPAWSQVAHAVDADAAAEGGSTLLLPTSRTASYTWGTTTDEPLSALAHSPVVDRPSAPLGEPSATRVLDAIDQLAAQGGSQPGLAKSLARMGVRRIVVRHDLAPAQLAASWQSTEATLASSPGFTRTSSYDGLTLWRIAPAGASSYTSTDRVWGAAESTIALATIGELGGAVDLTSPADAELVTDTYRRRVYNNGAPVQRAYGPTLPADDPSPTRIGDHDLPPGGPTEPQVTRVYDGLDGIDASSSGADPFAQNYAGPGSAPWAAIDGDPRTAWLTGDGESIATLLLRPAQATRGTMRLRFAAGATRPVAVEVSTAAGSHRVTVGGRDVVSAPVAAAAHGQVRIRLIAPAGSRRPVMGLTEVSLPGLRTGTALLIPASVDPGRQQLLLTADPRARIGAPASGEDVDSMRREVTLTAATDWPVRIWVRAGPAKNATGIGSACGGAGMLSLDGRRIPLRSTGPLGSGTNRIASDTGLVQAVPCATASMTAGRHRIELLPPAGGLVVAAAFGASPPPAVTDARAVTMRHTSASVRRATLGAGPATTLALTEGYNAGWIATDARGTRLRPVRVDGWRQGFVVPAGGPGVVTIRFAPTRTHRLGLAIGALAVLVLAGAWLLGRRSRAARGPDDPPVRAAPAGGALVLALVVCVLIGGPVGLAAAAVTHLGSRRRFGEIAVAAMGLAGIAMLILGVVDQRSAGSAIGQFLACVTVAALARGLSSSGEPPAVPATPGRSTTARRS